MPSSSVDDFLKVWHATIQRKDPTVLEPWVADEVQFSSPALFRPKEGKREVTALLADVLAALSGYRVTKTWIDGNEVLLEFDANVGRTSLQGIDRITLGPDGRMAQLKVFIRPFRGLVAVMTAVAERQIARMPFPARPLARLRMAMSRRR